MTMKHTKKMIMVPEVEWLTMLNMIKGFESLAREKVGTEMKMAKVLRDPKLSEDVKSKKYSWLYKQRRQLKKEIADEASKPQKIIIDPEQLDSLKADLSKYLGVAPTKVAPIRPVPRGIPIRRQRRIGRRKKEVALDDSDEFFRGDESFRGNESFRGDESFRDNESLGDEEFLDASNEYNLLPGQFDRPDKQSTSKQYIIHPDYKDDFIGILKKGYSNRLEINPKLKMKHFIKGVLTGPNNIAKKAMVK